MILTFRNAKKLNASIFGNMIHPHTLDMTNENFEAENLSGRCQEN